ncbi:hypothetical protein ACN4EE_08190 [Geminocystis sp. CENA526]
MLQKVRPVFVIEYGTNTWPSFGATPEKLKQLMTKYNYLIYSFNSIKKTLATITEDIWQSPYTNLVLMPEEINHQIFQ